MYLTDPPPEAKHKPVLPENIVIGGDSAGGGLVLALLQILRDTPGLKLPAGAVLISPVSKIGMTFHSLMPDSGPILHIVSPVYSKTRAQCVLEAYGREIY